MITELENFDQQGVGEKTLKFPSDESKAMWVIKTLIENLDNLMHKFTQYMCCCDFTKAGWKWNFFIKTWAFENNDNSDVIVEKVHISKQILHIFALFCF